MMSVQVDTRNGFEPGAPQTLFTGEDVGALLSPSGSDVSANLALAVPTYDVTSDGQRFVVSQIVETQSDEEDTPTLTIVENWFKEFEKK